MKAMLLSLLLIALRSGSTDDAANFRCGNPREERDHGRPEDGDRDD
jgi:hypothetical protein